MTTSLLPDVCGVRPPDPYAISPLQAREVLGAGRRELATYVAQLLASPWNLEVQEGMCDWLVTRGADYAAIHASLRTPEAA